MGVGTTFKPAEATAKDNIIEVVDDEVGSTGDSCVVGGLHTLALLDLGTEGVGLGNAKVQSNDMLDILEEVNG